MQEASLHLVVLVADGPGGRRQEIAQTIRTLGHEVIARESSLGDLGRITAEEHPDVAFVVVSDSDTKALRLIDRIVHEAACPVIALLDVEDPAFVKEAAKRGIFAYITGDESEEMESSIEIVLRRFAEYHNLEAAFSRRAVTERAKGILMERHDVDEDAAFEILRDHARRHSKKLVEIAATIVSMRGLLPADRRDDALQEP